MNKMTVVSIITVFGLWAHISLAEGIFTPPKHQISAQRAEWRKTHPVKPTGGLIERKSTIPSATILIKNCQDKLPINTLDEITSELRVVSKLPFALNAKSRIGMAVELVDNPDMATISIYPEDMKASVNIAKLSADRPSPELLIKRVAKEILRAALITLGSGYAQTPCFANPVFNLKDLDGINTFRISPDTATHLVAANRVGIQFLSFSTYRQACQEGWAPAPTNDVQKAIWEEVHQLPTEPIKIKPETKPVKD